MKTKNVILLLSIGIVFLSCNVKNSQRSQKELEMIRQSQLAKEEIKSYSFLECMYHDPYFPKFLVDKCKNVLLKLCQEIETENPKSLEELYVLSHSATRKINELEDEFMRNDSEIETGARECLAGEFGFIATTYGFDAEIEELISPRNW